MPSRPRLTTAMRDALTRARHDPLRRTHTNQPGGAPWPAHANTLRALTARGLLQHTRTRNRRATPMDQWHITDAGRDALKPPPPHVHHDKPLYLAHPSRGGGDYTHDAHRSIDPLEAVNPAELDADWFGQAAIRHAEAADRDRRARKLARDTRAT